MIPVLSFTSLDSLSYCFGFNVSSTFQIWILCQISLSRQLKIRGVGFVLTKLLTHFEMLIASHALHCVNGHYLYSFSFDSLVNCFGLSVR